MKLPTMPLSSKRLNSLTVSLCGEFTKIMLSDDSHEILSACSRAIDFIGIIGASRSLEESQHETP